MKEFKFIYRDKDGKKKEIIIKAKYKEHARKIFKETIGADNYRICCI